MQDVFLSYLILKLTKKDDGYSKTILITLKASDFFRKIFWRRMNLNFGNWFGKKLKMSFCNSRFFSTSSAKILRSIIIREKVQSKGKQSSPYHIPACLSR